jgi:hypothetical protein
METKTTHPKWFFPCMMLALGIVIGGVIVFLIVQPTVDTWAKAGGEMSAKIQDLYSAGTIIYEEAPPDAPTGIPILNGMASISIVGMAVPAQHGKMIPRWYIPAKVEPLALGVDRPSSVFYIDLQTHKLDGPHRPMMVQPQ